MTNLPNQAEICGDVAKIYLPQGKVALIDAEDLGRVSAHRWRAAWLHYDWRVFGWVEGRNILLHRFIMNAQPGQPVDHVNHEGLDNRKANLRVCTRSENNRNRRGKSTKRTSKFKGVVPVRGRWQARITRDQREIYLGTFDTEEQAARAYDSKSLEIHGDFARPNFAEVTV